MRAGEAKAPGRRSLALRAIVVVVALLVGWLLGRGAGQAGERSTGGGSEAEAIHMRAGVPVGFSRTPGGAAAAVAAYQRAFASPAILRPGVLRKRIEAVAAPDYVAEMLAVNSPGGERIAAGPIGAGLASGLQTLYSAVPIGYEVESFTPQRARILTWGFTLLGNASAVEPAAYFGLSHTELVWSKDGWRIAETRAGFGPTPKLATSPGPLGGYDVMNLVQRLKSYELAP